MDLLAESITEAIVSGEIANTDRVLNIVYDINCSFLFGVAVSMQSVAMYNPDLAIRSHFFTDHIGEDYLQRVNTFTSKDVNAEVRIYKVSSAFIDIFPSPKQWSYATFSRLVALQYLSETIENLLYIDADVACKGSLARLPGINFNGGKFVAVTRDVPFMQEKPAKRLVMEGLPGNYFSAGIVYLQFEAWARNDSMNKAIAMLVSDPQHTKYKCLDRDILNTLFFSYCIFTSGDYDRSYGIDYELKNKSDEDYKETITDGTKLIHYADITKSWNDWVNHPCRKCFNEAYQVSCRNSMAFIPATNEKQYQMKYQHAKKNGDTFNAFIYFIELKLNKYKRKLFGQ